MAGQIAGAHSMFPFMATAVLQLPYTETTMLSGFFLKEKPPLNRLDRGTLIGEPL
jgi:hypothetical protein